MRINLQTRKMNEVPYGGVFIANNDDVSMGFRPNEFDAYIKAEEPNDFIELKNWNMLTYKIYWSLSQAEVAFTGIILPLRRVKEEENEIYRRR